jgi:hypothetical protein
VGTGRQADSKTPSLKPCCLDLRSRENDTEREVQVATMTTVVKGMVLTALVQGFLVCPMGRHADSEKAGHGVIPADTRSAVQGATVTQ